MTQVRLGVVLYLIGWEDDAVKDLLVQITKRSKTKPMEHWVDTDIRFI